MNVGFISLGCSKNLVDTEMTIGLFKKNNFKIVNNPKEADIIVVNTCGFIESAKQEAVDTILEMSKHKQGKCKYLIAMGCFVQRYKEDLEKLLPEVDLFLAINDYDNIWEEICKLLSANCRDEQTPALNSKDSCLDYMDRVISTGDTTAYLKIAEGCSNKCTYCAIPYIRGPFESRKMEEILEEAQNLAQKGIKELIVIAQDTTKYGIDIYGKSCLAELLDNLAKIDGLKWIRFLYTYPETITDELLEVVANNEKICQYFDIPIQHISDSILKKMNRKSDSHSIKNLLSKIREKMPNAVLRTSLIVGFPGESEKDFEELYNFVESAKFDKLGVFKYSKEDGTPAEKLPGQIHHMTKTSRYNKIMKLQQGISYENMKKHIGKEYEALVEGRSFDGKYYIARTKMDVPDMDGVVYIENSKKISIGDFVQVVISGVQDYDLIADLLSIK